MSVHVEWDNEEQTIILWSFVGRWTWGEFDRRLKSLSDMLDSGRASCRFDLDVRQMSILPPDMVTRASSQLSEKSR